MAAPLVGDVYIKKFNVNLKRPQNLDVPASLETPPGQQYIKNLDIQASKKERQSEFEAAAYLYGLMYTINVDSYPHSNLVILYAQVKTAKSLSKCNRLVRARRMAEDALVLASNGKKLGTSSERFDYCVLEAARTLREITKKFFDDGKFESAKLRSETGRLHCTYLLGPDHFQTKQFGMILDLIEKRKLNEDALKDVGSTQKPTSPSPSPKNAGSAVSTSPKRSSDDESTNTTAKPWSGFKSGATLLQVPNSKNDLVKQQDQDQSKPSDTSSKHRGRNKHRKSSTGGSRPLSVASSNSPGTIGHCFDSVVETGLYVSPLQWAPLVRGTLINALERTHRFLMDARGSYPRGSDKHTRRVRLAVLDTGIDVDKIPKSYRRRIKDPQCLIPGLQDGAKQDPDGHGTNIVLILLDIFPHLDIHVYRVFENTRNVKSDYIAPAIQMAIDQEVDIISMSFGFDDQQVEIREQIKIANNKEILIFAAASNQGGRGLIPVAWPARENNVFCIFATDDEGNKYKHNPSAEFMTPKFATLGENIKPSNAKGQVSISGTSFATPIAAATAALFLDFARIGDTATYGTFAHVDKISQYSSIEALFLASGEIRDGLHYIKPWTIFEFEDWDRGAVNYAIGTVLKRVHGMPSPMPAAKQLS